MAGNISLDELVALNDEIAALVRSGVPLELGLSGFGRSVTGRLGRFAKQLGQSIAQGKSLPQSLDESPADFPPVYRAVVTAGIRSGRLPAALESLAASARNLQDVRRSIGLALLYPIVLTVAAYFGLWLVLTQIMPALLSVYEGDSPPFWTAVAQIGQWANRSVPIPATGRTVIVGWIPPLMLVIAASATWLSSRGARWLGGGTGGRLAAWIPLAGPAVRNGRLAALAETLGLLVEQDVPLGEALVLAADVAGDRRLARAARKIAATLAQGGSPPQAEQLAGFPPLLAWLVSSGGRQQSFVALSRHVADTYRRRMASQSRWLRDYLPMWLVILIGGSLVALVATTTFLPFSEMMQSLSEPSSRSIRIAP